MDTTSAKRLRSMVGHGIALLVVSSTIVGCGLVLAAGAGAGAGYVAAEETDGDGHHAIESDDSE